MSGVVNICWNGYFEFVWNRITRPREHGLSWQSVLSNVGLGNSSYNINTIEYWCAKNSEGLTPAG